MPMSAATNMLPSVVAFGQDDNVLVGTPAKRQAVFAPDMGSCHGDHSSHVLKMPLWHAGWPPLAHARHSPQSSGSLGGPTMT